MRRLSSLPLLLSALALVGHAAAQGSDTCATAQIIAGNGLFAFDTTVATTDGLGDALCLAFGNNQIYNDVWWQWTAASTELISVNDCGQTTLDSRIAVYDGSCGGPILACNDDAPNTCGAGSLQSDVVFSATAGHVYTIRVGAYSATGHGTGNISVGPPPPPVIEVTMVNPANGHTYYQLPGSSWTTAQQNAIALGGNLVTVNDQAEQDWIVANFHNYQGVDIDLWSGLTDAAVEGTFVWVSGQPVTYTNWDLGEPNNANGNENYMALRKNNPLALWNDLADAPTGFHANPHGLVEVENSPLVSFCSGDGIDPNVTTPCPCSNFGATGNGCANSTNAAGANLHASGDPAADTVVLAGTGMPSTSGCIYLQGNATDDLVFGDGVRCTGGTLLRLRSKINSAGASQFPDSTDTITLSVRGGVTIGSGQIRYYQTYYRNAAAGFCPPQTFNVTNGYQITW